MGPATTDRVQRMIDADAAERFALDEHFDRLENFRAQRLPEVKGFMVTTDVRQSAGLPPTRIMQMDGISLLDPEQDETAGGLTPVTALLGPVDLATLDALITAGIAASRAEAARWALARIRDQPAYAQLGERAREPGGPQLRAGLDRAVQDQLQSTLDEQVKVHFTDGGVQRVALLQRSDDPSVEPGDLLVRIFIEEAEEDPPLRAWNRDHETMIRELQRELEESLPCASYLDFWFGENGRQGKRRIRLGSPPDADTAASRAEAIGWVLPRIRERPAYARLSERARELDELKAHF